MLVCGPDVAEFAATGARDRFAVAMLDLADAVVCGT